MADIDNFIGTTGNDTQEFDQNWKNLYGISGDDVLGSERAGLSNIEGGAGDDYLYTAWSAGVTYADIYGGSGGDWIQGGATDEADYIYGGAGDDIVEQNFNDDAPAGADTIEGGKGRDALYGGKGNDSIYGGGDDDSGEDITAGPSGASKTLPAGLFGGEGDDYLDGGDGNDLLVGGLGADYEIGGRGNDVFHYESVDDSPKGKANRDTIHDFKKGDKIDLFVIDAIEGGGDNDFDYIGASKFSGDAGELRFSKYKLQGDTDGDKVADIEIKLDGVIKFKESYLEL